MPFAFQHWTATADGLESYQNTDLTARLSDDNTELQFYRNNQLLEDEDSIHVVGSCPGSAVGAGKSCSAWHRHDCRSRTGDTANECSCYCDALPRVVVPQPDCPDGSEGIVYASATYRVEIVKPCIEWTLVDCGLRVGSRGCPCVCGEPTEENIVEEAIHYIYLIGAASSAGLGTVALIVVLHDTTRLLEQW